ncbi:hypothetical protein [Photobacterium sp. J15]|uniref:hypothetical protein n=1 Tax=Photobacterium sp. J15 TaxID=265901 RepID=UPI0007E407EB|nr:hypothetical protein [Photobacterium sp. J15]
MNTYKLVLPDEYYEYMREAGKLLDENFNLPLTDPKRKENLLKVEQLHAKALAVKESVLNKDGGAKQ